MGSWGTGIKQSDAFADVYDTFFDLYNNGGNPVDISTQIKIDFSEILENDEEKHEFWFALALAQWETKCLDFNVLNTVEDIISNNSDIKLWENLGAPNSDLKKRKVALNKFLVQIKSERPKPKLRKKIKVKTPIYNVGDCIVFKLKDGFYGGAVVIESDHHPKLASNLIATTRLNQQIKPTINDFKNIEILVCNYKYTGFPDRAQIRWHYPDQFKNYQDIYELIGNLNVEFTYDNSNRDGKGYLFDNSTSFDWSIAPIADLQFESEKTKPKSDKIVTLKQLIKNVL